MEICPPERSYPLCAEDEAISDVPAELAALFTYVTYWLDPAYACTSPRPPFPTPNTLESLVIIGKITIENLRIRLDNPFYRCADPEILWCCFGFLNFRVSPPLFPPTTPLTSPIATRHCKASSHPPFPFSSYSATPFFVSRQNEMSRFKA